MTADAPLDPRPGTGHRSPGAGGHRAGAPELLAELLEQPTVVIERLCERLAEAYEARRSRVPTGAGGRRVPVPDPSRPGAYVERFILDGQRARLSAAALETLAIVAYKQPISRAQIASIRGVDPDGVLRTLQGRGYIDQVGRDPGPGPGHVVRHHAGVPEKLGLDSLDDLPAIAEFIPGADVVEALEEGLRIVPSRDTSRDTNPDTNPAPHAE
jgi:segregation and condensation protein B